MKSREVQPRADSDEEISNASSQNSDSEPEASDIEPNDDSDDNAQDSQSSTGSESESESDHANDQEALQDISFGALAEAQAKLNPNSRKRKLTDRDNDDSHESEKPQSEHDNQKWKYDPTSRDKQQDTSRTSKHAPTVISSRNPVTRRREIFSPPPSAKFRDPRFDAAVTSDSRRGNTSSTHRAHEAYAFLSEYQAKEVLDLKAQMKKTRDVDQQADLKRQIMSIEAKLRNAETQRREAQILQEHKRTEREAIREGKKSKAYYLKPSEVKKQIIQERRDAMGKKARDKSDKRKKMREKTKEARDMPRVRRLAG